MATTSRAKARRAARAAQRAAQSDPERENNRVLARNRRATWQYEITQRLEAGIELRGSEIKALRMGRGSIAEAYCRPRGGQLWLIGAHIARYEPAGEQNHELTRDRRLLVHRREIQQLEAAFEQRRLTLVPLQALPEARPRQAGDRRGPLVSASTRSASASASARPTAKSPASYAKTTSEPRAGRARRLRMDGRPGRSPASVMTYLRLM